MTISCYNYTYIHLHILQIEEVALVIDKSTNRRRGFIFVTFLSEDSVDEITKKTFHQLEATQVTIICEEVEI